MKSSELVLRAAIKELINEDRPRTPLVRVGSVRDTYTPIAIPIRKQLGYIAAVKVLDKGFDYFDTGCVRISNFPVAEMSKQLDIEEPVAKDVIKAANEDFKSLNDDVYKVVKFYFRNSPPKWGTDKANFDDLDDVGRDDVKTLLKDIMGKKCLTFDVNQAISGMTGADATLTREKFVQEIVRYLDDQHTVFQGFIEGLRDKASENTVDLNTTAQKETAAYNAAKDACK